MKLIKQIICVLLPLLSLPSFCESSGQVKIINVDLSGKNQIPEVSIPRKGWQYQDGALQNNDSKDAVITIRSKNWNTYEIEFSVRRIQELNPDNHFDLALSSPNEKSRIYFRNDQAYLLIPSLHIHEAFGSKWQTPLPAGPDAAWANLVYSVAGDQVTIKMNGKVLASTDRLPKATTVIQFTAYQEIIQIKDLQIRVFDTKENNAEASASPSPNMAMNAGFEQCTLGDLPDFWGVSHWGIADPYWVTHYDQWRRNFRTDDKTAWEGKRSMRLENPGDQPVSSSLTLISCNFRTNMQKTYTLSAYMKADHPGMMVRMFTDPFNRKNGKVFTLTPQWERYTITYTRENPSLYSDMLRFQMQNRGVVWIDGVQLEAGTEATPFRVADADKQLFVHEGNENKQLYDVPEYAPALLPKAPKMDGTLSDPVWRSLPPVSFRTVNGEQPKEKTFLRVGYTPEGLYVGIDATEKNSGEIRCTQSKRDGYVWKDPSIEIFLDPKFTRSTYRQLAFNADGVQYDTDDISDVDWNGQWQVRTAKKADGSGWTAEAFLPFCDMKIDEFTGPVFGFNVCRNNPRSNELSCWAPTFGTFHEPLRFGHLKLREDVLRAYRLGIRKASLQVDGDGRPQVALTLFNGSSRQFSGKATGRVLDGNGREITAFEVPCVLKPEAEEQLTCKLPDHTPNAPAAAQLMMLSDAGQLMNVSKAGIVRQKGLQANVQYDYYTTEKELILQVNSGMDVKPFRAAILNLKITGKDGDVFTESLPMKSDTLRKSIPIAAFPNGEYHLEARLTDGANTLGRGGCTFGKYPPPEAGSEVRIDHFRRVVSVNGEPFIPLGFFWENQLTAPMLDQLGEYGVNAIQTYHYKDLLVPEVLEAARRNHIMLMPDLMVQGKEARDEEKFRTIIDALKNNPELLAWYSFDEVFTTDWGKNNYATVTEVLKKAQACDPYHPVVLLDNATGLNNLINAKYPFPGKIPTADGYVYPPTVNFTKIDRLSKLIVEQAAEQSSPAWVVLLASGYAFHVSRDLTDAEQECQLYISLINGARGLFYFAGWPKAPSTMKTMGRLFAEVNQLKEVWLSTETAPSGTCTSGDIRFTVKQFQGALYLIAVNMSGKPKDVRFNFFTRSIGENAEVLFENRTLPLSGKGLEDHFDAFRRHVYKIPLVLKNGSDSSHADIDQ